MDINKIIITGRLTADIEPKQTPDGKSVVSFSVAVKRPLTKDKTDFINCVAWRNNADFLAKYAFKGDLVGIDGVLTQRQYDDKNGNKRTVYEVICDNVTILSRKDTPKEETVEADPKWETLKDEEDLPFD